jgi:hypothetical protein
VPVTATLTPALRQAKPGLYRSVRAFTAITPGVFVYFEATWDAEGKGGGVCVGLSTPDMPLDKLVGAPRRAAAALVPGTDAGAGSVPLSVGLYSSGDLVAEAVWTKHTAQYTVGATIGCLARLTPQPGAPAPCPAVPLALTAVCADGQRLEVRFFVNGVAAAAEAAPLVVPAGQVLKPTVSLYADKARVRPPAAPRCVCAA